MKTIRYWMNRAGKTGYSGPTEGAVLLKNGSVIMVPNFKDWARSHAILINIRQNNVSGILINAPVGGWIGHASVQGLRGPFTIYTGGDGTFESALANLNNGIMKASLVYRDQTASPEAELEALLKTHDWTSWASDDCSYVSAGDADSRRIRSLVEKLPEEVVNSIFAKYDRHIINLLDKCIQR